MYQFRCMINVVDKEYLKAFGKNLQKIRNQKGFSQEQLALKADISQSQIARIESGDINTTISTTKVIARALNMESWELFKF